MATPYTIHTDIKFKPLELIDVAALERATKEQWVNQTLCAVNDSVVRLGVLQGEFHWHKHDNEDEFFYVVAAASVSISRAARSSCGRNRALRCRRASCIARARRSAPSC